jgi:hypothetical protein
MLPTAGAELRDWSRGMEVGLMALLDGLEARNGK